MPNKPDTTLRTQPTTSATADLSQFATNLSSATGGAYETSSARTAITMAGRALFVRFDAATGESGMLMFHGSTAGTSYGYRVDVTSDDLRLVDDTNGVILAVALPGVDATADTFSAQFCTRANPLTTGASDAYVTEAIVYNETDASVSVSQATHAVCTVSASENIAIGGYYNGTGTLASQYSNTIREVRIGARWHSTAEFWEDYGTGETSSGTGAELRQPLVPMPQTLAQDAEFAGPQFLHAGAQAKATRQRLAGPIVNYYNPEAWPVGGVDSVFEFITGTRYDFQNATPGHADGPGGASDRGRDFEQTNNEYLRATDSAVGTALSNASIDFMISCWVKFESITANGQWLFSVTNGSSTNTANIVLFVNGSGSLRCGWEVSGTYTTAATGSTLSTGTWYHIAVVCTHSGGNRTATLYLNGSSDGSGTQADTTTAQSTVIIGGAAHISRGLDGVITELKIDDISSMSSFAYATFAAAEAALDTGSLIPWSPLRWWKFRQPSDGYEPARNFREVTIGGNTYRAHANLYWRRPVPPVFDYAIVRVFAEVIYTGGTTHDAIDLAVTSSTRRPGQFVLQGQTVADYSVTETISAAASGDEYEIEFSTPLRLARDPQGMTHIYLSTRINSGSPSGDTWIKIRAVHVTPYKRTPSASFPLSPGN